MPHRGEQLRGDSMPHPGGLMRLLAVLMQPPLEARLQGGLKRPQGALMPLQEDLMSPLEVLLQLQEGRRQVAQLLAEPLPVEPPLAGLTLPLAVLMPPRAGSTPLPAGSIPPLQGLTPPPRGSTQPPEEQLLVEQPLVEQPLEDSIPLGASRLLLEGVAKPLGCRLPVDPVGMRLLVERVGAGGMLPLGERLGPAGGMLLLAEPPLQGETLI
mmetsp:Transcript_16997/g.22458  ORF Transcript_16997/g.22458 Transcript_16997/m.22458 type:complete len:212 (+) Transcript_16997:880-1515(+)